MKKFIALWIVSFMALSSLSAGDVITYTATEKLPEIAKRPTDANGLYIYGFNTGIRSHTFLDGVGTITFYKDVTSIGDYAFCYCTDLTSITIPNSVTSIGYGAFAGCTGLTSITIPNSVTSIGVYAFQSCTGLASVTIGNSVTSIGHRAFGDCTGLTSIEIPNSVTSIISEAFAGCTGLTSIEIPNSVTSIGEKAFSGCTGLTSIIVESDNTIYDSRNNCNAIIETATNTLIQGCNTTVIPNNVTSIGRRAFDGCTGLTSITIPNSVTSIGYQAFDGCTGLTSITIPNSVKGIGDGAFVGCNNLKSVSINSDSIVSVNHYYYNTSSMSSIFGSQVTEYILGDDVHSIGDYTFYKNVNLISVSIGNSVTSIGRRAFAGCTGLTSIEIPNSVTSIINKAFEGCTGLTSIEIPNSVTSIGSYAFEDCTGLTSVIIGESVTNIGDGTFWRCTRLTSITIPNSVTSIGYGAFEDCTGLTSITIPNSVTSIGSYAFEGCTGLTSITIPNSVTSIEEKAFSDCTGLTSIIVRAITPPKCGTSYDGYSSFYKVPTTISVYIPCGTKEAYQSAWIWKDFKNYIETPNHTLAVTTQNEDMGSVVITQEPSCDDNNSVFKAVANKGYHFVQWNDGNTDNPRTVAVIQDTTFVAEFAPGSEYTITATCNSQQGTVSGSGVYAEGTLVTLTATAYEHYNFTQWTDGNTDNPRKITVERDATYTAEFAIDQHFITATCDPQQGSITGTGTYDYGTRATLTATANKGYEFLQWSNGIKDNPYSFIVVDNITLEAQFIPTTAVENVSANDDTTPRKVLRDGQVYILRNGKVYTIQGQEIKE